MATVDVLLPTQGIREQGLIFQIDAFLNQSYRKMQLWVLIDSDNASFVASTIKAKVKRHERVKLIIVPEEWRGKHGHRPIKYAIENLPLEGDFVMTSGDDDCVMPWGVEKLAENTNDVDMVIGLCHATRRNHDDSEVVLGKNIVLGEITGSCCLYRTSRVKEVGYDDELYEADWVLISKMLHYPSRQINSVIFVMPQSF